MRYNAVLLFKIIPALFIIIGSTISYAQQSAGDNKCLECHSDSANLKELTDQSAQVFISPEFGEHSVHNELSCTGCHADPGGYPHPEVVGLIQCSSCHEIESNEYLSGPHGNPLTVSLEIAPKCWDCHKLHLIRKSSDELSNVHKKNESKACLQCHGDEDNNRKLINLTNSTDDDISIGNLKNGMHYLAQKNGDAQNPLTCSKCHGSHLLSEEIGKEWLADYSLEADFCGECHESESISFKRNLHFKQEITSVIGDINLTCSDCHQEHLLNNDPFHGNKEMASGQVTNKCVECHLPVRISGSFSQNVRGFIPTIDPFHGTNSMGGELYFSNCSSCHGIHELVTFSDLSSEESNSIIVSECGSCHPNAVVNFVSSPVHLAQGEVLDSEESIARYVFLAIIVLMITLILLSVTRDFYKLYGRKKN